MRSGDAADFGQLLASVDDLLHAIGDLAHCEEACRALRTLADHLHGLGVSAA